MGTSAGLAIFVAIGSYLLGSVPSAYLIVKGVTGEDITQHGTGNVGAMNVRRSTGSWGWFVVAMLSDAAKGIVPLLVAKALSGIPLLVPYNLSALALMPPTGHYIPPLPDALAVLAQLPLPLLALAGAVAGHNYSLWMAFIEKRFKRTGKGLATGGGALLIYDWRYLVLTLAAALLVIAVTRIMLAGQVAAAFAFPLSSLALGSPDWPFAIAAGAFVYAAHHKRFIGMLRGEEPRLYIDDGKGPRG